MVKSWRS